MRHLPLSVALIAGLLLSGGLRRHGHSQLQGRYVLHRCEAFRRLPRPWRDAVMECRRVDHNPRECAC